MSTYPFMQVDAFTVRPLAGNPCAIVFDADDLSADQMLAIAKEMNLSETAFVRRSAVADFGARYFTPAEEIPLAGHPTIATIHALIERGQIVLSTGGTAVTLELPAGVIKVEIEADGRRPRDRASRRRQGWRATSKAMRPGAGRCRSPPGPKSRPAATRIVG